MKSRILKSTLFASCLWSMATLVNPAPVLQHPDTGEQLADNQVFTYRMSDEAPTLDPQMNQDTEGFNIIRDLFEGLFNQDSTGKLTPGVAKRFTVSDNNRTYIFHLRETAKWSNGDPVTAADFVYAWRRAVNPETASPYSWYAELASIKNASDIIQGKMDAAVLGVKALGPHTLEVKLDKSVPYFPEMTTFSTFFPTHQLTIEAHGSAWTKPGNLVSNGAYVLKEYVPNEYHTRVRNTAYWDNDSTIIEKVTGRIINDGNQALTRYFAGELDHTGIPAGQYPNLKEEYPKQATSIPRLCTYYFTINHTESAHPALQDVRVRQALSYALDRDVIVSNVLKGGQSPAYFFTHSATANFDPPAISYAALTQSERDARAVKLITDAGYGPSNPLKLKMIYNTSEQHKLIVTVASQMWKQKLGVEIELTNFEWKTFLDIRHRQQFDLARSGWCGDYNEASTFLDVMTSTSGVNDGRYMNKEVDQLMNESKILDNPGPNYNRVEQILAAEMALIPIYNYSNVFMLSPDIRGWAYNNVQGIWYSKDIYRVP